jgi:NAD-dependent dihydropyrimidine dehydrogenase PreA subunit
MAKGERRHRVHLDPRLCKGIEGCGICVELCRPKVLGPATALSSRGVHQATVLVPEACTGCDLCMLYGPDLAVAGEHREGAGDE